MGGLTRLVSLPSAGGITRARSPRSAGLGPMAVWGTHIGGLFMFSFIIIIIITRVNNLKIIPFKYLCGGG